MKVIAVTPFHNRVEISKIFWENAQDIGLDVIAIVSDVENKELAQKYALKVIWSDNKPLGAKWQKGIVELKNYDFDFFLLLGSDDLISQKLLDIYKKEFETNQTKYIGLMDAVAMDFKSKLFRLFNGYRTHRRGESLGSGRVMHKSILEQLNYEIIEPNINYGIDGSITQSMYSLGLVNKLVRTGLKPYRVGIKVGNALNKSMPNSPFVHTVDLKGYYSEKVIKMLYK